MKKDKDKTDHGDAWHLADLLRVGYLPNVWLADEATRQLRRLGQPSHSRNTHMGTAEQRTDARIEEWDPRGDHQHPTILSMLDG